MKNVTPKQDSLTLLVTKGDGSEFKLELPPGARITFGPAVPYGKTKNGFGEGNPNGYALRVYGDKTNNNLLAVFCDVRSFRDIKMPVAKLVLREAGKSVWKSDENGYKVEEEVTREKAFEDLHLLENGPSKK